MSKTSRGDKGEKEVVKILKKNKEYHVLLNDVTFLNEKSEMTHQIDHVFIHPHGVFVIETKNYYGEINADTGESFWLKTVRGKTERIFNPLKQNKNHVRIIRKLLKNKYDVISLVVFVKNNAPYLADDNVINLNDLLLFIESYPYEKMLSKNEIDEICSIIKLNMLDISKEEHVENISYLKQINKELKAEIAYAIENRKCPRCDGNIIQKDNHFYCDKCDYKFNL